MVSNLGYCNTAIPEIKTNISKKGVISQYVRFRTWSYSSFNWIHEMFYVNGKKVVPINIGEYLTPLALAIWIQDDGSRRGNGLKLCTNCFTINECEILVKALKDNFNLNCTIQKTGIENQFIIYIKVESMDTLRDIVKPFIVPSMKYKLNYK